MEMNMAKFSEKLGELMELAKVRKKTYWNIRKSMIFSKIFLWILSRWKKYLIFWKETGIDVLRIQENDMDGLIL